MSKATKTTKTAVPRMTEEEKRMNPDDYIINPGTGKQVKRDSPMGKKLVKAEETGEEVSKTMTETARLVFFIQTLADQLGLEDSVVKTAFSDDSVKVEMPRGFPSVWGGKQKTEKHPDHPKQPSNAYIFFNKAVHKAVAEANPGVKHTEIISMVGKMWKDTVEEDRKEYNEKAAADKIRYENAMKIFETEHPELARLKTSPSDKPTKKMAYHVFCEENRKIKESEFPDLEGKQITKLLADDWEELKNSDKVKYAEYQAIADEANKGFEERVISYNNSPGSSPKLSKVEQAKADDPEHYMLNTKTNRYVLREGWKKNPDGSFTKTVKKEAGSPKKSVKKVEKKVSKPLKEEEEEDDDDLLIE